MPTRFAAFGQEGNAWAASAHPTKLGVLVLRGGMCTYAVSGCLVTTRNGGVVGWAFMPTRFAAFGQEGNAWAASAHPTELGVLVFWGWRVYPCGFRLPCDNAKRRCRRVGIYAHAV